VNGDGGDRLSQGHGHLENVQVRRKHTPPWPRRKPVGPPRPTLYTQSMLDSAMTSKGSRGDSPFRAQATAVIGPAFYPMTVECHS
jgi:hypothetical protein